LATKPTRWNVQDDDFEPHAVLSDCRLQGAAPPPPRFRRLLSLHASLIGLRCQYCGLLLRWVGELGGVTRALAGREDGKGGKGQASAVCSNT
jgi:hypothetical protein